MSQKRAGKLRRRAARKLAISGALRAEQRDRERTARAAIGHANWQAMADRAAGRDATLRHAAKGNRL